MKFRKKPVMIEATRWFKMGDHPAVKPFPFGWAVAKAEGYPDYNPDDLGIIETLEGHHQVTPGDWIITGVKGEHYPCKPDIFEMTYEPVGLTDPLTKL
jgi:hypothetical protein